MLGISIYPYKEEISDTLAYLELAAKYGFERVFTNLLSIEKGEEDEVIEQMKVAITKARDLGMEVILDLSPSVFDQLGINYNDLSFFKKMGATGIRLDSTFDGLIESLMTFDKSGLDIEVNISYDVFYLENIISYKPNKKHLIGCHNFYPQRYTGLDYEHFVKCNKKYKEMGLRTAAFINSHSAIYGPHEYTDGLCTLEMHRDLPIEVQAKHLIAMGNVDDIIIANSFASEDELKKLSELPKDQIEFNVTFNKDVSTIEREVVLAHQHFNRGDINSFSHRSTYVKLDYKQKNIEPNNTYEKIDLGDITVGNNKFGQYKGELNIVRKSMRNEGQKNVVARIVDNEIFLIKYVKPWSKFIFKEQNIESR